MDNSENEQLLWSDIANIAKHGKSLAESAIILIDNGKIREGAALLVISIEEFRKFLMVLNDPNSKQIYQHKHKFAPIKEVGQGLEKVLLEVNVTGHLPPDAPQESIEKALNTRKVMAEHFREIFNLETMRSRLLNQNLKTHNPNEFDYVRIATKLAPSMKAMALELWEAVLKPLYEIEDFKNAYSKD